MSLGRIAIALALIVSAAAATRVNAALVNLELRPGTQTVGVGNTFSLDLYAVSSTNQSIGSIDAILVWDSSMLRLAGRTDTGPYPWLSSSFPNDCALDGLNAPCSGLPANDGDALYRAFRNFSAPAIATPTGLLVTSFQFTALAMTPSTTVSIPAMRGNFTRSYVVDGYVAGLEITGTLGSATVTVVPEPAGLVILGCLVFAMMRRRMR